MPSIQVPAFGTVMIFNVSQKVADYLNETGASPFGSAYGVKSRASVQKWLDELEAQL